MQKSTVTGSHRTGVGVEVGGKGEGVEVGGRGVEVGDGINVVGVIVETGSGVRSGAQETVNNKSRMAKSARFIVIELELRGDYLVGQVSSSQ
jgi:hypothetical protein